MTDPRTGRFDYIELPAADAEGVAATRDFLSDVFGWSYQMWGDGYADTNDSGVTSGISATDHSGASPLPVVYASDLEALREKVVSAGGSITRDIFDFPGGRRFHFKEPSGNELAAWTEVPHE